ncbi:hypothetical protein MBOT_11780 [Mycobacterium botniense]|uniref:PPE family protein n=2 Tax=Mycobacterium botniense TaxID=84962 RepID=A0A7I9XVJ5_9MYCO|nr:hypothetical protein MBOT_11780 [Mycobacterium botniense]
MLAAATAWEVLADNLCSAAASFRRMIADLTTEGWMGLASVAMAAVASTYVSWMTDTVARVEQTAGQARQAAAAYETAFAMMVPPAVIAANRAQLALLGRRNPYGHQAHAIAETEADYHDMWAHNAATMYCYAAQSATASSLAPFLPPLHTATSCTTELLSAPAALRRLGQPVPATIPAAAAVGRAGCLGPLSVPPAWTLTGTPESRRAAGYRFIAKPLRHNTTDLVPAWG